MRLPYDMGNAGDLLKHGVLAEFVRWQCELNESFRFIDLFGGEPWNEPVPEAVLRRVRALPAGALRTAQSEIDHGRYYGSGHVVRCTAKAVGRTDVRVLVSDRDPGRRERLRESGLSMLEKEFPCCSAGTSQYDTYVALDAISNKVTDGDLVLIDPFHRFLPDKAQTVVPQMAEISERGAVLLFALNWKPKNRVGRRFEDLLKKHLPGAWRVTCPPLRGTGVEGENRYYAEVVLAASAFQRDASCPAGAELRRRLDKFAGHLAAALFLPDESLKLRIVGEGVDSGRVGSGPDDLRRSERSARVGAPRRMFHFECRQVAGVLAELHGDEVDRLFQVAVLVRVPPRLPSTVVNGALRTTADRWRGTPAGVGSRHGRADRHQPFHRRDRVRRRRRSTHGQRLPLSPRQEVRPDDRAHRHARKRAQRPRERTGTARHSVGTASDLEEKDVCRTTHSASPRGSEIRAQSLCSAVATASNPDG